MPAAIGAERARLLAELGEGVLIERAVLDGAGRVVIPRWIRITGPVLQRLKGCAGKGRAEGVRERLMSLLVDEETEARRTLAEQLSMLGPWDEMPSGPDALSAFGRSMRAGEPYDVAFVDLDSPHSGGVRLIREMRMLEKRLRPQSRTRMAIVALSARADRGRILEAFLEGCDACVEKPVHSDHLQTHISLLGLTDELAAMQAS